MSFQSASQSVYTTHPFHAGAGAAGAGAGALAGAGAGAAPAPAGTFLPGTKVQVGGHRVVVEKYLSEGGFAHVYVVRLAQPVDGRDVAVLKRVAVPDKQALASMRTEVETMKKLKGHRHIVRYIDSHASQLKGGGYEVFLLMEYCAGGGLIDFMNTRLQNRLTEPEIVAIFSDVAEGVACMHYLDPPLLHRDLKVENVLISSSGGGGGGGGGGDGNGSGNANGRSPCYKLCDFGSAAPPRPPASSAAEGRLIEDDVQRHTTLQYRSPEMVDVYRKQPIDEKSDIWALGVLLYKLCYYTTPFEDVGQMAILNASFKFPAYPPFSDRLKLLISSMLKENPRQRPTIYEVVSQVCAMQGKQVPIRDIYKRNHDLPADTAPARVGAVFSAPIQETQIIPDIAPMRRGRPGKPPSSHPPSAKPSPSPDPFAALDGGIIATSRSADELATRFPTLDQFQILHEKRDKFDFDPVAGAGRDKDEDRAAAGDDGGDDLARRLTNALADEAFIKRVDLQSKPVSQPDSYRQPSADSQLHQPSPKRPVMVSTGTMTSPSPPAAAAAASAEVNVLDRPAIYRFPTAQHDRRPSSQPWAAESEKRQFGETLPNKQPGPGLRASMEKVLPSLPSRPSLESARPSLYATSRDPVGARSQSANSKARPLSIHAAAKYDSPPPLQADDSARSARSSRSSLDFPSHPAAYDGGAPLQHARTDTDFERAGSAANIASDMDFLRAKEEEESNRKQREKRYSGGGGGAKHAKRSSLSSTLTLPGTKALLAGRFGDAFRRFEGNSRDRDNDTSSPVEAPLSPTRTDAVDGDGDLLDHDYSHSADASADAADDDDISPEMRRELERRRLSQEEKRVASAAAEYRRRVAETGEGGRSGGRKLVAAPYGNSSSSSSSAMIQSKVQSLLQEQQNKPAPRKTAAGYGRYTEPERTSEAEYEQPPPPSRVDRPAVSSRSSRPAMPSEASGLLSSQQQQQQQQQRTGSSASRPAAPPKPSNLRVRNSPAEADASNTPDHDWEASFSRRFPSLSGLEMVETEIELPKFRGLRTREV